MMVMCAHNGVPWQVSMFDVDQQCVWVRACASLSCSKIKTRCLLTCRSNGNVQYDDQSITGMIASKPNSHSMMMKVVAHQSLRLNIVHVFDCSTQFFYAFSKMCHCGHCKCIRSGFAVAIKVVIKLGVQMVQLSSAQPPALHLRSMVRMYKCMRCIMQILL